MPRKRRIFLRDALPDAKLAYSDTNEDIAATARAMNVGQGAVVIGVTGSADLLLLSLRDNPGFVAGYDLNPAQGALGELKRAAIDALTYDEYATLLGYAGTREDRRRLAMRIAPGLDEDVRAFWRRDDMRAAIETGLWRSGSSTSQDHAGWRHAVEGLRAWLTSSELEVALGVRGSAEEREGLRRKVARDDARYAEPAVVHNNHFKFSVFRYADGIANEPSAAKYVEAYLPPGSVRPALTPEDFASIRERLHRISFQTEAITEALLEMPSGAFDRAYLSNVVEYLTLAEEQALVEALLSHGKEGAIVVLLYVALTPAQRRDVLDHGAWAERGLSRLVERSRREAELREAGQRAATAMKERLAGVDGATARRWAVGMGERVRRLSRGEAGRALRKVGSALREADYAAMTRAARERVEQAIQEIEGRVAETRQVSQDDISLIENRARTMALHSDLHANLRATYAARSFYGYDYAILQKVVRRGATYDIPKP